jgi:hypothetical protein
MSMDFSWLNNREYQQIIETWKDKKIEDFLFHFSKRTDFPLEQLAQQIVGLKKAQSKFPEFINQGFAFPPRRALEQASSEETAKYKANLVSYKSSIDLTGGFGIDSFYLAQNSKLHRYIEQTPELFDLADYNLKKAFEGDRIKTYNQSAEEFLHSFKSKVDLIYLDPDRRDATKRLYLLEETKPDVIELLPELLQKAETVMIKVSPLLDLTYLLNRVKGLFEIHLVEFQKELKEILILATNTEKPKKLILANLDDNLTFEWPISTSISPEVKAVEPQQNLLIPSPGFEKILRANLIPLPDSIFKIKKDSMLLVSEGSLANYPGKPFTIVSQPSAKDLKALIKKHRVSIISYNYFQKVRDLEKKYKIKPVSNPDFYLLFTKDQNEKAMVLRLKTV